MTTTSNKDQEKHNYPFLKKIGESCSNENTERNNRYLINTCLLSPKFQTIEFVENPEHIKQ